MPDVTRFLRRQRNVCSATKSSARGRGAVQRFVHASGADKAVAVRVAAAVPERVAERHGPAIGQHVFGITVEIERVVLRLLRSVVIPGPDRGPGYDLSHRRGVSRRRHLEWIDLAIAARPGTDDGHVVDLRGTVAVNAAQIDRKRVGSVKGVSL